MVEFWNFGSLIVVEYEFQVSLWYLNGCGSYEGGSKQMIHPVWAFLWLNSAVPNQQEFMQRVDLGKSLLNFESAWKNPHWRETLSVTTAMKLLHPVKVSKCMKEPTLEINLSTETSKKAFASCEDLKVHERTHTEGKFFDFFVRHGHSSWCWYLYMQGMKFECEDYFELFFHTVYW